MNYYIITPRKGSIMNNTYYARNEEWGTENGTDYMIIAVYRNKTLLSKERVTRQKDECWEFCINFIKGNYTAFDLLSDIVGEDSAAWHIDEDCFDPCWNNPNELIDFLYPTEYQMSNEKRKEGRDIINKNLAKYLEKNSG